MTLDPIVLGHVFVKGSEVPPPVAFAPGDLHPSIDAGISQPEQGRMQSRARAAIGAWLDVIGQRVRDEVAWGVLFVAPDMQIRLATEADWYKCARRGGTAHLLCAVEAHERILLEHAEVRNMGGDIVWCGRVPIIVEGEPMATKTGRVLTVDAAP